MFGRSVRAEPEELTRPLPGDALIHAPIGSFTHAITIERSPAGVWPWLVQMGAGRGGWYSYDLIDNRGHRSADHIMPELQHVAPGAVFPALPGAVDAFVLLQLDPGSSLVLGWVPAPGAEPIVTWAIVLEAQGSGRTRLIERGRVRGPYRPFGLPEGIARRLGPLAHGIMVRRHLQGIAKRAEAMHGA